MEIKKNSALITYFLSFYMVRSTQVLARAHVGQVASGPPVYAFGPTHSSVH